MALDGWVALEGGGLAVQLVSPSGTPSGATSEKEMKPVTLGAKV